VQAYKWLERLAAAPPAAGTPAARVHLGAARGSYAAAAVGLCKFNPVQLTHGLKAPGFNP
jgi:hypothetical protein